MAFNDPELLYTMDFEEGGFLGWAPAVNGIFVQIEGLLTCALPVAESHLSPADLHIGAVVDLGGLIHAAATVSHHIWAPHYSIDALANGLEIQTGGLTLRRIAQVEAIPVDAGKGRSRILPAHPGPGHWEVTNASGTRHLIEVDNNQVMRRLRLSGGEFPYPGDDR